MITNPEAGKSPESKFVVDMTRLTESDQEELIELRKTYPSFEDILKYDSYFLTPEEHALKGSTTAFTGGYPTTPKALIIFPDKLKEINEKRKEMGTFEFYASQLNLFTGLDFEKQGPGEIAEANLGICNETDYTCSPPSFNGHLLDATLFGKRLDELAKSAIKTAQSNLDKFSENPNSEMFSAFNLTEELLLFYLSSATKNLELFQKYYRDKK